MYKELDLVRCYYKPKLSVGSSILSQDQASYSTRTKEWPAARLGDIYPLGVHSVGLRYHQMTYSYINNTGPVSDTEFRLVLPM